MRWQTYYSMLHHQFCARHLPRHAVDEGLLAGCGERDESGGAESKFLTPATDDEQLDPAQGARPAGRTETSRCRPRGVMAAWNGRVPIMPATETKRE